MHNKDVDILIVGGGIVGLAVAYALIRRLANCSLAVLDKESELATHQTGHNSGVLHAGIYYQPGSLKARLAVEGIEKMVSFCSDQKINYDRCGKLVVATNEKELFQLKKVAERAQANGVNAIYMSPDEVLELEPHVRCIAALHIPSTGRVDFSDVARSLADVVIKNGGEIHTGIEVLKAKRKLEGWLVETSEKSITTRYLVGCAGLQSDRLARKAGHKPELTILGFRGKYLDITGPSADLVNGLIYPVPDDRFPFLGVHLSRNLNNQVSAGPNAVLALSRENYSGSKISLQDIAELVLWPGTTRLATRYWQSGLEELKQSLSIKRFVDAARRLVPDLAYEDISLGMTGIRAQAVDIRGYLVNDFTLKSDKSSLHVLNAPSPAATAALSIGELVADQIASSLNR